MPDMNITIDGGRGRGILPKNVSVRCKYDISHNLFSQLLAGITLFSENTNILIALTKLFCWNFTSHAFPVEIIKKHFSVS